MAATTMPPRRWEWLRDISILDWSQFDALTGLRAAFFVASPILVGALTGDLRPALYATIGANFIANTEGRAPDATSLKMLLVACFLVPAVLAFGTLVGVNEYAAVLLVGPGVLGFLTLRSNRGWAQVGLTCAIVFAVGVTLPGASLPSAYERLWGAGAGCLWALLGVTIHRLSTRRQYSAVKQAPTGDSRHVHPLMVGELFHSESFRQAVATGLAASVGLAIGIALQLPRDLWILITVIIAMRQGVGPTISSTMVLVVGTGTGAVLAAAITLTTSNIWVLLALMSVFAFGMFSTRLVSQALFQAFVTPFLILLLNIIYPGDWWFALARIADVAIGGGLAILFVSLLSWEVGLTQPGRTIHP